MKKKLFKILKYSLIYSSIFLGIIFTNNYISAVECVEPAGYDTSIEKYNSSDNVFIAQILSNKSINNTDLINVKVLKNYKGLLKEGEKTTIKTPIILSSVKKEEDGSLQNCGFDTFLNRGDIYSFYTNYTNIDTDLWTYSFSGNEKFTSMYDAVKNMNIIAVSSGDNMSTEASVIISDSCKIWYDGCNDCTRTIVGGDYTCTNRICENKNTAFCSEVFLETREKDISEDKFEENAKLEKEKAYAKEIELQKKLELEIKKNKEYVEKLRKQQEDFRKNSLKEIENRKKIEKYKTIAENLRLQKQESIRKLRDNIIKNKYETSVIKENSSSLKTIDIKNEFNSNTDSNKNNIITNNSLKKSNISYVRERGFSLSSKIFTILFFTLLGSIIYYYLHKYKIINNKERKKEKINKIKFEKDKIFEDKEGKQNSEDSFVNNFSLFKRSNNNLKNIKYKDDNDNFDNIEKETKDDDISILSSISQPNKTEIPKKFSLTRIVKKKNKKKKNKKRR